MGGSSKPIYLLLTGGTSSQMCIKSGKCFTTSRTGCALIRDTFLESFLGQVDGEVPTIPLRTVSKVTPNSFVSFITERTVGERVFHSSSHDGL